MIRNNVISARQVVVSEQLVCQGNMYVNGCLQCSPSFTMNIGPQVIRARPDGISIYPASSPNPSVSITPQGIRIDTGAGLYFASDPATMALGIIDDPARFAECPHHLTTARAAKQYIDQRALGIAFDAITCTQISAPDERGITLRGPITFAGKVAFSGPTSYSHTTVTTYRPDAEPVPHIAQTSIVFINNTQAGNVIDIAGMQDRTQSIQFLDASGVNLPTLIRFDNGGCFLHTGASRFSVVEGGIRCTSDVFDSFFPTRAEANPDESIFAQIYASSAAVNADGTMLIVGNTQDAGGRGCAHVFRRIPGASHFERLAGKRVGTFNVGMTGQGSHVAINARGNIIASTNGQYVWLWSLDVADEITRILVPHPVTDLVMCASAQVFAAADATHVTFYGVSEGSWIPLFTSTEIGAPVCLSCDGSIAFAIARSGDTAQVARVDVVAQTIEKGDPVAPATARICCNARGDVWQVDDVASAYALTTNAHIDGTTIIISQQQVERSRFVMPCGIQSLTISGNGAIIFACLANGLARLLY